MAEYRSEYALVLGYGYVFGVALLVNCFLGKHRG